MLDPIKANKAETHVSKFCTFCTKNVYDKKLQIVV